jgi:signal transduction histidine kinase
MGFGAYIRFLGDIAMTDVWIVDENLDLITTWQMPGAEKQYNYTDLPEDAEKVVTDAFKGNTTFSEGFSNLLNKPSLTVGTPVKADGNIFGVLLLHSPVEGVETAALQGFGILTISIASAFILSVILSVLFAVAFTKPLKKMQNTAMQLANGDYKVKTGIAQKDEIGQLALSIDALSEKLDIASHESENLDKLRREFIANISHELRTPITVIRGSLKALYDGVITDPEQLKDYYGQMLNESVFLQNLVNDLLDLSRLQNPDFKVGMQELNLSDVLSDAVRSAQNMARQKQINIKQETDVQIRVFSGDYSRLRQMFLIVLDNAIKFSAPGGDIIVTLKNNTVSIHDYGSGISETDLPYIFERFYKVQSDENKNGTGLGLAIAKQIADRHNIKITVKSEKGNGSEFIFQFEK